MNDSKEMIVQIYEEVLSYQRYASKTSLNRTTFFYYIYSPNTSDLHK